MTELKTRKYQGSTLDEVLPKIREELGDDAIVVRQREGLKGGVGGFFQKRCVEVEARPPAGTDPAPAAPAPTGFSVTDGPAAGPDMPAPQSTASLAEAMLAQAGAAGFGAQLADAQQEQAALGVDPQPSSTSAPDPFTTGIGAALTVDDILGGAAPPAAAPAPQAAPDPAPAPEVQPVVPGAARARGRVVTSPQVDALPAAAAPEPAAVAPPQPVAPQPVAPPFAPVVAATAPLAPAAPVEEPTGRPARAERAIETLEDRGLVRAFAERLVDDVVAYRLPLQPGARLTTLVSRELAQQIPSAPLSGAGSRVSAWVGAGGAGKTNAIAAFARAHAEAGMMQVACVALRTPDGGATLRTALQGADIHVYVPADDTEAVTLVGQLVAAGMTVLIDTPAVSPRNDVEAKALGRRLRRMGVESVHLCIPATLGLQVARDVVAAAAPLKATAMTITHGDETERLGAAVQLAIDAALPISYVNSGPATAGRGLRAADPVELAKALIG